MDTPTPVTLGVSGLPHSTGQTVTGSGRWEGHAYTHAYAYQLVIGRIGGWAIPYPLTLPQAVAGITTFVTMVVTLQWWYPVTGLVGAVAGVAVPVLAIRLIGMIRPEGRSVVNWASGHLRAALLTIQGGQSLTITPTGLVSGPGGERSPQRVVSGVRRRASPPVEGTTRAPIPVQANAVVTNAVVTNAVITNALVTSLGHRKTVDVDAGHPNSGQVQSLQDASAPSPQPWASSQVKG